jgi:hypothetical protein
MDQAAWTATWRMASQGNVRASSVSIGLFDLCDENLSFVAMAAQD